MVIISKDPNAAQVKELTRFFNALRPKHEIDEIGATYIAPKYTDTVRASVAAQDAAKAMFFQLETKYDLAAILGAQQRADPVPPPSEPKPPTSKPPTSKPHPTKRIRYSGVRDGALSRRAEPRSDLRPEFFQNMLRMGNDVSNLVSPTGSEYKPPHKIFILDGRGHVTAAILIMFAIAMLLVAGMFQAFVPQKTSP